MDRSQREELARSVLARSRADQTEVIVQSEVLGLTRFTHNAVHQNITQRDTSVRIRAIVDSRTGVVSTNVLNAAALEAALERALALANVAPRDAGMPALHRSEMSPAGPQSCFPATARTSPEERAQMAARVFEVSLANNLWAAGYISTSATGTTIANSAGTLVSFESTNATINVKQNGPDSTGYAEYLSPDITTLDARAVAELAARKARESRQPVTVPPGAWTVLVEPAAFGELLAYLTDHFSVLAVDEGASFIDRGLGVRYLGESVNIRDDFAAPGLAGMPFDYEGNPTQIIPLVENGSVTNLVTDAYWAHKLGLANTGHGLPAPNADGPSIRNVVVGGGAKSKDDLIAGIERGLLVTRFWYIRTVDQRRTTVTGMTRDGTFLIENGKVTRGVKNLRFNDSIVDVLQTAEFSNEVTRTGGYSYSMIVPAVKLENFHFSSSTEF